MKLSIIGQGDSFLHASLSRGDKLIAESGAMVSMESNIELKGQMQGGLLASVARSLVNDESFFNQYFEATGGDGDVLLSPMLPGDISILDVSPHKSYFVNDGAFLAAGHSVNLSVQTQGIGKAIFGGTGGFFITKASGEGPLVVSGFGTCMELNVSEGNPVTIDNYHVVAWDSNLSYEMALTTNKNSGFLGKIANSVMSGEGIVTRFKGNGTVLVCSRNRGAFVGWLASQMPSSR